MRQAITTKYLGPTNTLPSRIRVKAQAGSMIVSWDHGLDTYENHRAAALAFAAKWEWGDAWAGGALPDGTGYCFIDVSKLSKD